MMRNPAVMSYILYHWGLHVRKHYLHPIVLCLQDYAYFHFEDLFLGHFHFWHTIAQLFWLSDGFGFWSTHVVNYSLVVATCE